MRIVSYVSKRRSAKGILGAVAIQRALNEWKFGCFLVFYSQKTDFKRYIALQPCSVVSIGWKSVKVFTVSSVQRSQLYMFVLWLRSGW